MKVDVEKNLSTGLFDLVDADTGTALRHGKTGARIDGGGHKDQAAAERQANHLRDYYQRQEQKGN